MRATFSILGLYTYDPSIFNSLTDLTASITDADGQAHTKTIEAQDIVDNIVLELSELELVHPDGDYMTYAIGAWWKRRKDIFTKLLETTLYKYDAIANYDRREEWTDEGEILNNTAEHYAAGYDSSTPTLAGKDTATGKSTSGHTGRVSGNIGVMSTQELIMRQRDVVQFDVVMHIVHDFKQEFCLMIY